MLNPDKTRTEYGVTVKEKVIPMGAVWVKNYGIYKKGDKYKADRLLSADTGRVQGVTIHNTPGSANAETYTRATYPNQNMRDSRVHYYCDDAEAWQNLSENEVGWHAGDGKGNGNQTTVAIEIIMRGDAIKNDAKAEDNGARLAAAILNRHGLTVDQLYTHNHWMGLPDSIVNGAAKNCPVYILPHWTEFKAKVKSYMEYCGGFSAGSQPDDDDLLISTTLEEDTEPDNTPREWEKKAVEKAITRGIIAGDDNGDLRLHDTASRADVLVFLERCGIL